MSIQLTDQGVFTGILGHRHSWREYAYPESRVTFVLDKNLSCLPPCYELTVQFAGNPMNELLTPAIPDGASWPEAKRIALAHIEKVKGEYL